MKFPDLSARFIMAVSVIFTMCLLVLLMAALAVKKIISIELFISTLTPFFMIAREISDAYFKREDRKPTEEKKV